MGGPLKGPSKALKKRLARLERQPSDDYWVDPFEAASLLQWFLDCHAAVDAGKACEIPQYGPHPEPSPALVTILRDLDRIAERLAAERAEEGRG